MLFKWLCPTYRYPKVEDIPLESLSQAGIRGLILDLDDTLTPKNSDVFAPVVRQWLTEAQQHFQCYIVSNNRYPQHVRNISVMLNIPAVAQAHKPSPRYLKQALQEMNLPADQVLLVGDRLLTDVWGGNRLNMPTCLLTPINPNPPGVMRWVYQFEKWLLNHLY